MAWVDDRVWCHPKFTDLSASAFRLWVNGVAYSSGFGTKGRLTRGQLQTIGSTAKLRGELVKAGLWDDQGGGEVYIHDWDEHNGKRDERRAKDRERKRQERASAGQSAGQSAGRSSGASAGTARVDRVTGDRVTTTTAKGSRPNGIDDDRWRELERILGCVTDADSSTPSVLAVYARQLPIGMVAKVRESAEANRKRVGSGWVVNALKDEIRTREAA